MHPTPSLNKNFLWIPETRDDVVPGLDSMVTYTQPTYVTLTALQNAITNINNNIQTETNNLEIPNQGHSNVNKDLYYNTTHTDHTFQRKTQYTNTIIVEVLFYNKAISHINEKVIKSYRSKH